MRNILLLFVLLVSSAVSASADSIALPKVYQYRIYLKDKNHSQYSLDHPEAFLSQKSLERRRRQHIAVDSTDLPVSPYYIDKVKSLGLKIMGTSRWHNTIWVESKNDNVYDLVDSLPFVERSLRLYVSPDSIMEPKRVKVDNDMTPDSLAKGRYGNGFTQIDMFHGLSLHNAGFRGKGMTIAILDAGFKNADKIAALRSVNVVATKDCAPQRTDDIFKEHYHGTMVLSTMAANCPDTLIGTAPEADYVLIRTEDIPTETRAEEDSWTMGVEYADSIGADVINSSLGYTEWDGDSIGLELRQLDGKTTFVSQTASLLASKGMVLCNSAGNEGMGPWHKINVPADADDILTVGAVDRDSVIAMFSSLGPSQDGRVKPDVCALGAPAYVINGSGDLSTNYGTSFSSPILCGMVACLWQARPELDAYQIIDLVRSIGDRSQWPDNVYGYGIPDFSKYRSNPVGQDK